MIILEDIFTISKLCFTQKALFCIHCYKVERCMLTYSISNCFVQCRTSQMTNLPFNDGHEVRYMTLMNMKSPALYSWCATIEESPISWLPKVVN